MSFFDEREDRPSRTGTRRPPPRGPGTDRQTLLIRRAIAIGGGVLLLVLLFVLIKGCRESAREDAFRNYVRDVGALVQESDQESASLFQLLTRPGRRTPIQLQSEVNSFQSDASQLVDRARDTDHPGEADDAHRYFVEALEFRRDGMGRIARELPTALGDQGREEATARITVAMRSFLASDVIYDTRFAPKLSRAIEKEKLGDLEVPRSRFLTDLQWLRPTVVTERIDAIRGGGGGTGPVAPGLHGTALVSVTAKPGGKVLNAGGAATDIQVSPRLSFDVAFSNGGEHEEKDVTVAVTISGQGVKPIVREQRLPSIKPGEQKTVSIPLAATPPTGKPVTIKVDVKPVPGEKKVDNNSQRFPAIFTR